MAKLPGIADLGPTPAAPETRPVGSYDVSAFARGGQAIAQGAERLGAGIEKAGQGAGELATDISHWQYGVAHSQFLTQKVDLDAATAQDTNYGPDDSGKTLEQRYTEKLNGIQNDAASQIGTGPLREYFLNRTAPVVEEGIVRARAHATGLENNASIAYVQQSGNKTIDQAVAAGDDATRQQLIDSHNELIDGLQAKGAITPVQAVQMKQSWGHQYATADLLARADADPEGVRNLLRAEPGSNADLVNRIMAAEGDGKDPRSSARGGFIDSTWLDVLKRNRPDLVQGKSDEELLALRGDRALRRDMTEALRGENEAYLTRQGIDPTPGAQYLAHFLGPAGAAAVLKGDPNKPVSDVLAAAVGKDKAAQMVTANPSVLGAQLTGSVRQWADAKMGGATPGGGSLYDMLSPDVRAQVLAHVDTELHRRAADARIATAEAERARKDAAEQATNGYVQRMMNGDFNGITKQIADDQALASHPEMKMRLWGIAEQRAKEQVGGDAAQYGPGFWDAYKGILAPHDSPDRINDPSDLLRRAGPGGDLTLSGVQKLTQIYNENKKSVDQHAVNLTQQSLLSYAKSKLSFEQDTGPIKIRDPKGEQLFTAQFVPKFFAAYDKATASGKHPMDFLTQENVDKLIAGMRPKAEMDADRLRATGEATGEPVNAPVPPLPEGADATAWKEMVTHPPTTSDGRTPTPAQWGQMITILKANPSAEAQAAFDKYFAAAGYSAKDVLGALGGAKKSTTPRAAAAPIFQTERAPTADMLQ